MKTNIYIYGVGNKKAPINITIENRRFKNLNFILGPSKEEHNFLMENVGYYRKSFEEGTFAFCSDVWRVYILSKANGVYIDASTKIGDDFEKGVDKISIYKYVFIKEKADYLTNGFFSSNDKDFFKQMFKMYSSFNYGVVSTKALLEGPTLLTLKFNEYFKFKIDGFIQQKKDKEILLLIYLDFTNPDIVNNYGEGSGLRCGAKGAEEFRRNNKHLGVDVVEQGKYLSKKRFEEGKEIKKPFTLQRIRDVYDHTCNSEEVKSLKIMYKKIGNVPFFKKIFWSKFYRFFTLKKFCNLKKI